MNAYSICGYLWTAWVAIWFLWALQSKQTRQREGLASQISYRVPIAVAIWLILYARHLSPWWTGNILPYRGWFGWLGVAITVLGFALTFWARAILGGNWSGVVTIKVNHELIRTGPYRFVRHPIYTGILLAMAGSALVYDQWRSVVGVALLGVSFTIKRLKEEQFMRQTFGAQYDDYARTTGAIFPSLQRRNG
jgi:protein-S-isoprenylcysteine O-methyltransferase Ste14